MKLFTLAASLLLSTAALSYHVVVEKVQQGSVIVPACSVCMGGKMETTTTFTVSNNSCRRFSDSDFSVKVKTEPVGISGEQQAVVRIEMENDLIDCMGPTSNHTYKVVTKELQEGQRYILENRSVLNPSFE